MKFGRNYKLTIDTKNWNDQTQSYDTLDISMPITIEFDIIRGILTMSNACNFTLYNLSQSHREALHKNIMDAGHVRHMKFQAGYGDDLALAFAGQIYHCFSNRPSGSVDYFTEIDGFDGIFHTESIFPSGTDEIKKIKKFVKDMGPSITLGAVSPSIKGKSSRGESYSGNTVKIMGETYGGCAFFENGVLNILQANEFIDDGTVYLIDSENGMLGTPEREETGLRVNMIFSPEIKVARKAVLRSKSEPWMNGDYKIISVHHRGTISGAVCGSATTSIGLWSPFLGFGAGGLSGVEVSAL